MAVNFLRKMIFGCFGAKTIISMDNIWDHIKVQKWYPKHIFSIMHVWKTINTIQGLGKLLLHTNACSRGGVIYSLSLYIFIITIYSQSLYIFSITLYIHYHFQYSLSLYIFTITLYIHYHFIYSLSLKNARNLWLCWGTSLIN